ncbi:Prefoldin [Lactifluus subvellereus]|nr:Prefoldin [Lactifluus subvellereus]
MASLSDDTLRKILIQIQQTAVQSQRALSVTRQQVTEDSVNVYRGVGKMFMMIPRSTMEKDLRNQEKALTDDINSLNKKASYLEKQFNDAQSQLRDIFNSPSKQ